MARALSGTSDDAGDISAGSYGPNVFADFPCARESGQKWGGAGVDASSIPRLVGFDKVRFFKEVQPGHILEIRTELIKLKRGLAEGSAAAFIENICVCSAEIRTMV